MDKLLTYMGLHNGNDTSRLGRYAHAWRKI